MHQSVQIAIMRGLIDGGSVGALLGLYPGIYRRSIVPIARYSVVAGVSYAGFLGIANMYRFDI